MGFLFHGDDVLLFKVRFFWTPFLLAKEPVKLTAIVFTQFWKNNVAELSVPGMCLCLYISSIFISLGALLDLEFGKNTLLSAGEINIAQACLGSLTPMLGFAKCTKRTHLWLSWIVGFSSQHLG